MCHNGFISLHHNEEIIWGDGHDDRSDRQLFALWNGVHCMRQACHCSDVVGVCEQA
jgi:hypothetical protein